MAFVKKNKNHPPGDKYQKEREQFDQGQSLKPSTSHARQSSNPFLKGKDSSCFSSLPQDGYKAKGTKDEREAFVVIAQVPLENERVTDVMRTSLQSIKTRSGREDVEISAAKWKLGSYYFCHAF